jgi:hypothetical protein
MLPATGPKKFGVPTDLLNKSRTPLLRQYDESLATFFAIAPEDFVISRTPLRDYVPVPV